MDEAPAALRQAAIAQIVAGVINITFMWWVAYLGLTVVCGVLTLGIGMVCGMAAMVLFPIGMLEIIAGMMVLTDPKKSVPLMRVVAMIEMASILFGSIPSVLVGGVVLSIVGGDEVKHYLEG